VDAGDALVPDCDLPSITFDENPLDVLLLKIFRFLVQRHTGPKKPPPPCTAIGLGNPLGPYSRPMPRDLGPYSRPMPLDRFLVERHTGLLGGFNCLKF